MEMLPFFRTLLASSVMLSPLSLHAADNVNGYDALSFLEEPLAKEIGDTTFTLRGLIDVPLSIDHTNNDEIQEGIFGLIELGAFGQTDSALRLGLTYTAIYDSYSDDAYDDRLIGFVGGPYGTISAGNAAHILYDLTRRKPGVGNASLAHNLSLIHI